MRVCDERPGVTREGRPDDPAPGGRGGTDALAILRHDTPIDLLFTDVVMPGGMHGPQLAAEARRLRPELKVLYTSGYPGTEYRAEGLTADQLLSKPYEADELSAKLREILEGRPA